jgi:hypothetical protein
VLGHFAGDIVKNPKAAGVIIAASATKLSPLNPDDTGLSPNDTEIYIAALSPTGAKLWSKRLPLSKREQIFAAEVSGGFLYLAGVGNLWFSDHKALLAKIAVPLE